MDIHTAVIGLSTVVGAISMVGTLCQFVTGRAPNAKAVCGRIAVIALCAIAVSYVLLTPAKSSSQATAASPVVLTAEAHYQRAKQDYEDNNRPQAIKEAQQTILMEPTHKDAHKLLAACYGKDQNIEAAASEFKEASRLDPNDTEAQLGLAMCLETLGDKPGARTAYQFVLRHPQSNDTERQTAQVRLQALGR